jgi:ParB family transcriptional regulator, chromosome partitioning protein
MVSRHDLFMRLPWQKSSAKQLDLLGDELAPVAATSAARHKFKPSVRATPGGPCMVPIAHVHEDPANPRIEFPDAELDELADDIRLRGILVPLVVHPVDSTGRYLLHFGARRLRAAARAGLQEVPVVVRTAPADRYAQAAENLKRAALAPLDMARFIRQQIDGGDSHAEVARRLGMNLTTVAHHLSLLELPPVLAGALTSGRCTSPRTLHELSKVNEQLPEQVRSLIEGQGAVTREAVAALRASAADAGPPPAARLVVQAHAACDRLERLLAGIRSLDADPARAELAALKSRILTLSQHWPQGSDSQTPGTGRS